MPDVEELEAGPAARGGARERLPQGVGGRLRRARREAGARGRHGRGARRADVRQAGRRRGGARATLERLAGRRHAVVSGVCLIEGGRSRTAAAQTLVEFRALEEPLIDWYLASGEWRERAGGYAIQGRGAALVAAIEGDYPNVVGLPVATLLELAPGLLAADESALDADPA